ncbi:MAG: right-handed parallel beta-helix repeat-containing protein [Anaerolineae bacterium]|nr:right-handed parallel beta-helix repeat-containing protein [Anaerolineae bacterium]
MRKRCLIVTFGLGLSLILALLWMVQAQSSSAVAAASVESVEASEAELHVCPSGCPYSSVQAAVDAAGEGDVIKVAAGTYTDIHIRPRDEMTTTGVVTQVVYLTKTLTIEGGYATDNWITPDPENNPTILDAGGQGRLLYIVKNDIQPVIWGLRLTGGDATGLGGDPHNFFENDVGGGVYIFSANPTVERCRIYGNTANEGGGLFLNTQATLVDNWITGNTASNGAGVKAFFSGVTLRSNRIDSNVATGSGGGVDLFGVEALLDGNLIIENTAGWRGGGMKVEAFNATTSVNNVFADNQILSSGGSGSGLYFEGATAYLMHDTIAGNHGGDGSAVIVAYSSSWDPPSVAFTNTVLVDHNVGISAIGNSTVTVNSILWYNTPITVSTDVMATVVLENQYTGDPAFAADGYHIRAGSAAIDRGVDAGVTTDIDGEARPAPVGTRPDLGADEVSQLRIYLPLVVRNW